MLFDPTERDVDPFLFEVFRSGTVLPWPSKCVSSAKSGDFQLVVTNKVFRSGSKSDGPFSLTIAATR